MKKRILSIIMAICLVLSCVPITVFAANTDATELQNKLNSGGTVMLDKDYTIDSTLNVDRTVTLDLNGHVIKMTGSGTVIIIGGQASLTMIDSNKTATHTDSTLPAGGVITGGNATQNGGGVYVGDGCSMTMTGGTIENCSATGGGGLYVFSSGSFTMEGGTIENCSATYGGGVYVSKSTFAMESGTIENCSAKSGGGGGIYVSSGTFTMGDGEIKNCKSSFGGGGLCIVASGSGSLSTFTMTGGIIENCTSKNVSESAAIFAGNSNILANGGIVKGMVSLQPSSTVQATSSNSYTRFYDRVTNKGTISSGVYYGGVQDSSGTVSGTYHTVSFDSNGGSGSVPTQWFVNTDKAPALQPADPTKNGYQAFDGWYNGDTKYDFNLPVTQTITLKAKYKDAITYNISYDLAGGTATNPATYNVESDAITLNNPVKTAYTFTGWSGTGLTGENNMTVTIAKGSTGDRAYTAHFSQNNYTVKFDTNGGSSISDKTGVKWTDTVLDGITAPTKDGWEFTGWKCGDMTVNANTKYSDLVANDTVKSVTLVAQWKDIAAPTGEISVGTNKWNGFLNTITFGLFFKDTQSVTITASDNSGEDVTIEYLLSDKGLNKTDLASKEFTEYNSAFNINPDNKYVVYARLTDHAGNVTYISSDGIVLDATTPVITGVENGKTYCEAQTVTVAEEYIASVKVNGTEVTLDANNQFTLNPEEGTQTIVVTDKAGNVSAEMIVTVNDGHTYEWQDDNGQYWQKCKYCGYETAKKDIPTFTIDAPDTVCRTQDCEASVTLSNNISDAALSFEFIGLGGAIDTTVEDGKLYGVVTANGYPDAENSFNFVVYATTDDGFPFTVSKTVQIQNEHAGGVATCTELAICDTCGKPYGELDSTSHNLEKISATDATVTQTGNKEYWHCLDCGKYFADENGTTEITLDNTVIAKLPPEIIEGKGQSITDGESKELTFKSNASFSDFIRVELDGKTLDVKYYTVKEGSTIVTLKADYVATLSSGEHTIGIVSESGTATTTFTVNAKAIVNNDKKSPETGNDNETALLLALILSCGGAIVVTSAYSKRKKHSR